MPKLRRIECAVLPFGAGVAAFSLVPVLFPGGNFFGFRPPGGGNMLLGAAAAGILAGLALLRTLWSARSSVGACALRAQLFAALFFAGALCAARSSLTALTGGGHPITMGAAGEALSALGGRFKALLKSLPLKSGEDNALLEALLLGDRSALSPRTISAFRESGASHILALSGLHLGVIYGVVVRLGRVLGNSIVSGKLRAALTILTTGAYTVMTGAGPSISRAFLFILVRETGVLLGRRTDLRTTLAGSFILQLCIDAKALGEISFQLSYLALAGIAYIFPFLRDLYPQGTKKEDSTESPKKASSKSTILKKLHKGILDGRHVPRPLRFIWNSAALSIACQITTGPLAWHCFGTFPEYFLLTNLIAIPLTGLLIPAALLCAALSAIGLCPALVADAVSALSTTLRGSLEVIAGI